MNEKIKELAIQAKIQMVSEPRLQEFAQLIIAECIKIVEPSEYHKVWAQSFLGEFEGLELLQLRVEALERFKNDIN